MEENKSQIIIYQTENGETKLDVRFQDETVWLTQKLMAELFQTTSQNITIHLKNIFEEGELEERATCKDFLQVQKEGKRETGQTAEIISHRADNTKENMGLTNWKGDKKRYEQINDYSFSDFDFECSDVILTANMNAEAHSLKIEDFENCFK
jgi:hypothetical protein